MTSNNEAKQITKLLMCFLFINSIYADSSQIMNPGSYGRQATFVLIPLENSSQKALFPHVVAPINFLVWAPIQGVLPLNHDVTINDDATFLVMDISNNLVLIDATYADAILHTLNIEKKIICQCRAHDLLVVGAKLYHPNTITAIPLVPHKPEQCESSLAMKKALEEGTLKIEKKLVIIITSFNNKDWYKKNLDSVFMQNYTNYRIIYIDDRSPDGTGKLVQDYIKEKGQEFRTTLVLQSEWKSQMANHYYGVYMCDDDEIVCHLDGDDWLHDQEVLNTINEMYLKSDIWITYGLPLDSTGGRPPRASDEVMQKVIQRNTYRSEGCWAFSHFRTFYSWLFKSLKLQDLVYKGNFANMAPAPDVAMMYPMLEMAGFHTMLIDRDVYVVNKKNPISQCNITPYQVISELDRTIKGTWPAYEPLYKPAINRLAQFENKKADLIMWAENFSLELSAALNAIKAHLANLNNVIVFYDKSALSPKDLSALESAFPQYNFMDYNSKNTHFKSLLQYLLTLDSDYLIFTSPDFIIEQDRDIAFCIKELERTFAYAFYFHLENCKSLKNSYAPLSDEIIAWQPGYTKDIWEMPNMLGMVLYRKKDIENKLKNMNCATIHQFKEEWAHQEMPDRTVGLFFNY